MKKEEMVDYITKCIEENPEYRRLLNIRWEQRLLTAKVDYRGLPSTVSSYVRYLKIIADPYVGISIDNALDPTNCFFTLHMPLSVALTGQAHYFNSDFELTELQKMVKLFFNRLSILENVHTFEQFVQIKQQSQYTGISTYKVSCAFTG